MVTIVDGFGRSIFDWNITPAASDLQHMKNAGDYPPVVDASCAGLVLRQMRLQSRPGRARKSK